MLELEKETLERLADLVDRAADRAYASGCVDDALALIALLELLEGAAQ